MKFRNLLRPAPLAGFLIVLLVSKSFGTLWNYPGTGAWTPPTSLLGNVYDPPDAAIPMEAIASESPVQITLKIYSTPTPASGVNTNVSGTYDIFRKDPAAGSWGAPIGTVAVGTAIATWIDSGVVVGQMYEYGLAPTGTTTMKFANVLAGIKADRTLPRGRIAVVVANDVPARLPAEYAQYKADLVADGWVVHEILTPRAQDYLDNQSGTNAVASLTVTTPGTGYVNNDNVALSNGVHRALGQLKTTTGPLTSVTVTYGGGGFSPGDVLTMTGHTAGSGAVLTVGSVTTGNREYTNIRNQLISLYNTYPGELKNVAVIGKVALARSGVGYTGPDGHGNRAAVGTDAYYADMDGVWTDTGSNLNWYPAGSSSSTAAGDGTINFPEDGKFDATEFSEVTNPNSIAELGFGRVDLSNFVPGEYEAMRMYFNKLHRYKTASSDFLPGRKAIMRASFGMVSKAYLAGLPGVLGMSNLDYIATSDLPTVPADADADAAYTAANRPYLFYFKGSGGPAYSAGGKAVFWTGMQSHWGYWYASSISSGSNLMPRRLAEDNFCLSYTWSIGLLYLDTSFLYHRMGMGFDAGDMMRASISNRRSATSLYVKADSPLFMDHMGDPALRLFMFPPPKALCIIPSGGNPSLSWTASDSPAAGEPPVIGYHVYRAATSAGPFARITSAPVVGTSYSDTSVSSGLWHYQVKAVRLETTGGGTYYNASLGIGGSIDLSSPPAALVVTPAALPNANWNTAYSATLSATGGTPVFDWEVVSGSLPPGLALSPSGTISGLATAAGDYSFTVKATDRLGQSAQKQLLLTALSNNTNTFFAEANNYCGSFNSTEWTFYEPYLLMTGPSYLYQTFLRFDISGLNPNNGLARAKLILTLDERSQASSYALARAALTQDSGDGWVDSFVWAARPSDNPSVPEVYASSFPVAYETIEFDVTSMVRATLADDPARKVGLRLYTTRNAAFGSEVRFANRYASGNARPRLIIETTNAPAITIVSPSVSPASISVGSSLVINATATAITAQAASLAVQWSKSSGPGTVTFGTPTQASTTATFSSAGDYVLRLTANDGLLSSSKDLTVRVFTTPAGTTPITGPAFDPSLILRLPLDETSGTAAADASGVAPPNNGTLATVGGTGNPTWVSGGKIGRAINFDGSGQRVEVNDSATTPLDGMQKLTASLWIKLNAEDANSHAILVKRTSSTSSTTSYAITLSSAEKVSVSVANKTAVVGDTILAVGQWYHVVMLFDGSLATNNIQLYINGNPDKFGAMTTGLADNKIPLIPASKLRVGDYTATALGGTSLGFNGQVDEVRLYNRALSVDEIQVLAKAAPANVGPAIVAPASVTGEAGQAFALNATATDDGQPSPLLVGWNKLAGPGSLIFANSAAATTTATPSLAGEYTLRLSASDGDIVTFADVSASISGGSAPMDFGQWAISHGLPGDGTGLGAPDAMPAHDGIPNAMKFALGIDPNIAGYQGHVISGTVSESGENYLAITYIRPEPPPGGVTYDVKTCGDLSGWSTIETGEVSSTPDSPTAGFRTIIVRDTAPTSGLGANRFIRLEVGTP